MIKTYYYAVDKDGQGWYYDNPPIFDGESWNVDPTYDCLECMGAANEEVFLFVGEEPPIMDDDGEWVDPRKEGLFWSEEDFNFDFDKLLGTVKFPELNKGERIEMNLQFEFGIK